MFDTRLHGKCCRGFAFWGLTHLVHSPSLREARTEAGSMEDILDNDNKQAHGMYGA